MFALHMGQLAFSAAPRSFKSDFACFWPSFLARFLACARALAFPRTIGAQQGDAETMSDPVVGGGPRAACAARERRACECRSKDANWTGEWIFRDREKLARKKSHLAERKPKHDIGGGGSVGVSHPRARPRGAAGRCMRPARRVLHRLTASFDRAVARDAAFASLARAAASPHIRPRSRARMTAQATGAAAGCRRSAGDARRRALARGEAVACTRTAARCEPAGRRRPPLPPTALLPATAAAVGAVAGSSVSDARQTGHECDCSSHERKQR